MKLSLLNPILRIVLLIQCVFLPALANTNRTVPWQVYETPHFKIVFHEDVRPQADVAKAFLEDAYQKIRRDLGVRNRNVTITVVLTGLADESNGFATPLGHRIVIYTRPFQSLGSGDIAWLKRVLAHELTHQLTFLALRKGFWGIYSEVYKTSHIPAWFMEGVAQYEAETWDAKRNTFFAHVLYNSAMEPYPNLASYTKQDPVSGRILYEQGHAFVRFLVNRQGKGFLGPLLARFRVIPLWSEVKALLSPLTASILPLEDALKAKTGVGIKVLYKEFLDSLRAGMPAGKLPDQHAFLGGVPGFAMVFQIKALDSTTFLFTGQKEWEQAYTSLYLYKQGRITKVAPGFVNPVFDLSPDHGRVLYVQTYTNMDSDLEEKLFVQDLPTGQRRYISDGAAYPIFLGRDSIAFSRYHNARQTLVRCELAAHSIPCEDKAPESLMGIFALSKSSQGILMNATDTSGRTGVYEFASGSGFTRLSPDTVPAEFPIEAADGSIWMLRERGGLQQVDALDRATGRFHPIATYPLGTFFLHRSDSGTIATVVQTGSPGHWNLQPVEVAASSFKASVADSPVPVDTLMAHPSTTADTLVADTSLPADKVAVYRKPAFLSAPIPAFPASAAAKVASKEHPYRSLLEIRPLIGFPVFFPVFPGSAFGATILLQDPLSLHTLSVAASFSQGGPFYELAYGNLQTPVGIDVFASNTHENVDYWTPPPGWTEVDLVKRSTDLSLRLTIPSPWSLPRPHSLQAGLVAHQASYEYRLAGSTDESDAELLDGWSLHTREFRPQAFLGYNYFRPYAYMAVHPLLATELEGGGVLVLPDGGPLYFWYARQTVPLWRELTLTALYKGEIHDLGFRKYRATLPDFQNLWFHPGGEQGIDQDAYGSLDFPIHKGYMGEYLLLGLLNYVGGSFFGSYGFAEFRRNPGFSESGYERQRGSAGAKLNTLFHIMRRAPLQMSFSCYYDFIDESPAYRFQTELAGLPSSYSLLPGRRASLGKARNRQL